MKKLIIYLIFSMLPIFSLSAQQQLEYADSAYNYINAGRYADAERMLRLALKAEPDNNGNYLLLSNLGLVRREMKNYAGAMEALDAAVAMAPKSLVVRTNRAQTLLASNHGEEALDDLTVALEIDSLAQWPLLMKSLLLIDGKRFDEARPLLQRMRKYYPTSAPAYVASAKLAQHDNDNAGALSYFTEALQLDPNEEYFAMAIMAAINGDDLPQADTWLFEALEKYPRNGNLYILRAYTHKLRFQNEMAEIDFARGKEYGADKDLIDGFVSFMP